jgi:WD40 repeat protein
MFTTVVNEHVSVNSCWREKKQSKEVSIQTKPISTRNACHQSVKSKSTGTTIETQTDYPQDPDSIPGLVTFLESVFPRVKAQLDRNLVFAKKFNFNTRSAMIRQMTLSYPRHTLVSVTSLGYRIIAAFEKDESESILCFWNLNLGKINETKPSRKWNAPGHVRAISISANQPTLLCVGFNNGDVRLFDTETDQWSKQYKAHNQALSHIYWDKSTIISSAQDSSYCIWRYSKSKQKIELKSTHVTRKNYGCPVKLTLESGKFVLISFDSNKLGVFEVSDQTIAVLGTYLDVSTLSPIRIFSNLFEAPQISLAAHGLGYLPDIDLILKANENQKLRVKGYYAEEITRIMKYDRHLQTDREDRIGLLQGNEIIIFSSN